MEEDVLKDSPNPVTDPTPDPALTQRDEPQANPPMGDDGKPKGGGPADLNKPSDPKNDPDKPGDTDKPDEPSKDVPEAYEKFSLPEGFEYDEGKAKEFGALAKELGLSQEKAQRLVDMYVGSLQQGLSAQIEAVTARNKGWQEAARNDKEFGGADFERNLAVANEGLRRLGTPELISYLEESGLGNHPEVIRLCWRAGRLAGEDHQPDGGYTPGGRGAMSEAELAKKLFASEKE